MRKAHGEHNEQLCNHLLQIKGFNDWVVTTAFYAALNYVKHEIFPLNLPGKKKYPDFEQYFGLVDRGRLDKHESLRDLVCKNLNKCAGAYRWLLDSSKNSRYHNYRVSDQEAQKAKSMLEVVKGHCTKLTKTTKK